MKTPITSLFAALLVFVLFATTACNTVKGFGEDLERAGQSIQKSGN
ncbi:MAG: entericidin A/B family lipoprotein [Opitutales bacterium]